MIAFTMVLEIMHLFLRRAFPLPFSLKFDAITPTTQFAVEEEKRSLTRMDSADRGVS